VSSHDVTAVPTIRLWLLPCHECCDWSTC